MAHSVGRPLSDKHFRVVRCRGVAIIAIASAASLAPIGIDGPDRAGAIAQQPGRTDFNGDGYDDLVIADQNFDSGAENSGAVWIVPGSATGPRPTAVSGWSQSRAGMPGDPAPAERFGQAWTAGDFNADGFADLAVCIPGERVSGMDNAGALSVIFGSPTGLRATNSKLLNRTTAGIPGVPATSERWCSLGIVAGDFNRDGRDDLAVPSASTVDGFDDAGSVTVLLSSASGPSGVGATEINQASPGVPGSPETSGSFGINGLASGDFNGDGYDDLVVSAALSSSDGFAGGGGVYVFRGSASGLRTTGTQFVTRATQGVPGAPATNARFGRGFPAVADWNHDGYDDIVIADHTATVGGVLNAGQIVLLRGSASGLVAAGGKTIHQNSPGIPSSPEDNERFGYSALTSADFDGNGRPDLAATGDQEQVGTAIQAGAFFVLPGTSNSIGTTGTQIFTQDTTGVPGSVAQLVNFATGHLWSGDFNGDGYDDLVVPCGHCEASGQSYAGYVMVFRGSSTGLTAVGLRQIKRSTLPGLTDDSFSQFGSAS